MTKALIQALQRHVVETGERRRASRVRLRVGKFTCVEPDLLRTAFARQRTGTFLDQAALEIVDGPFIGYCRACEREYEPAIELEYACPGCRAPLDDIRSGRELKIESVEWEAAEAALV